MFNLSSKNIISKTSMGLLLLLVSGWVFAQPSFNVNVTPNAIGPGSYTTLFFDINNPTPNPVTMMSFNMVLPAGVENGGTVTNDCNGVLTATSGGTVINLTDGEVSAFQNCRVEVSVSSSMMGITAFPVVALSTSAGSSNSISFNLTVDTNLPGFTHSFSPSTVDLGEPSTITYVINNSVNPNLRTNVQFSDDFPTGFILSSPSNVTNDCNGTLNTTSNSISLTAGAVMANQSCTVVVDVIAGAIGDYTNNTSELISNDQMFNVASSGFSEADITVLGGNLILSKEFTNDPVAPGGIVNLEYNIQNYDRNNPATNIEFDDDLDSVISGLIANNLPINNVCGVGSQISFSGGSLSLTNGNLPAEGNCTFNVDVSVPVTAVPGSYGSTSSVVTYDQDGSPQVGNDASANLFVASAPLIKKEFIDDPVTAGSSVTLEFEITNSSPTSIATDINFIDELTTFLPFPISVTLPAPDFCGAGSNINIIFPGTEQQALSMTGGQLGVAASCTFTVIIDIPTDMPSGVFENITEPVSALVNGEVVVGNQAVDDLVVVAAPILNKEFTDDPVLPGDTVTLEFSLIHGDEESADATGITFTDDLDAALTGLTALGLPMSDVCGTGSLIDGINFLTFTGGTLSPGESCTFSVTLQVPAGAAYGSFTNTTSSVNANVNGLAVASQAATDDLIISGMNFTITNLTDVFVEGVGAVYDMEVYLENLSPSDDVTGIFFTLNLAAALPGANDISAIGLPQNDDCGVGSQISGTTNLIFTGGNLLAGGDCTFVVQLALPAAAPLGDYSYTSSLLSYTIGGSAATAEPASDEISIIEGFDFSKTFTDDPVGAGDNVTLSFEIINNSSLDAATAITFTDDLDATLSGLVAVGLPVNDVCGAGSQISGTNLLTLTGGNLPANGSCQFDVTLQVPGSATGGTYPNITSLISGMMSGAAVFGNAATDGLQIRALALSKSFAGDVAAGSTVDLTFNLVNQDSGLVQQDITFTDDLNAMIPGAVAVGLPVNDVCGTGSFLSGTDTISLTGGTLVESDSCMFMVTVLIPPGTVAGDYLNTTSDVVARNNQGGVPATDMLTVVPPPVFDKSFAVAFANLNQPVSLTFTIDNSLSSLAASNLSFVDNLPAELIVASPSNAMTTCSGGSISAAPGSNLISYSGGSVSANSTCTLTVDVAGIAVGIHQNTSGDLTSSSGNSGPAVASIEIVGPPLFSKSFAVPLANLNQPVTLTFTIDNTLSALPANSLDFTDNLPANSVVASPANASTTCLGGTITAVSSSSVVNYTGGSVAASSICTLSVDVIGTVVGVFNNISGDLTSTAGNSGQASADFEVVGAPAFSKSFSANQANLNQPVTLTFTIDNTLSGLPANGLDFTDNFPANLFVSTPSNVATTCAGGTLTAANGSSVVSYTGGSVAASSLCTVSVDVVGVAVGILSNVSGDLTSNAGNSGQASDNIEIVDAPIFTKSFAVPLANLNQVVPLTFTIDNTAIALAANNLNFIDNFPADLIVASPANASTTCNGGTLVAADGSSVVSYSGGSTPANTSCTVSVNVTGIAVGVLNNMTGDLTSSAGNSGPASDSIEIVGAPVFTKLFSTAQANLNQVVNLTFTIDNTANDLAANNIDFTDSFPAGLEVATPANESTTCTGGAISAVVGNTSVSYSGGSILANSSCTVTVDVIGTGAGVLNNVSGDLTSSAGNSGQASDSIEILNLLSINKFFSETDIFAGELVDVNFEIINNNPVPVTDLSFTDDLDAFVPGAEAVGLPLNDVCGVGSTLSGTSVISLASGQIPANGSCLMTVSIQIPLDLQGVFVNQTSPISYTINGNPTVGGPNSAGNAPLTINGNPPIPTQIPANQFNWILLLSIFLIGFMSVKRMRRV